MTIPQKPVWQWAALVLLSVGAISLLELAALPAGFMIGAMVPAIALGAGGGTIRLPRIIVFCVQGVIGCLIAQSITPSILGYVVHHWPVVLLVTATTLLASSTVALVLVKFGHMPGSTAAWGSSPGAAGAMTAMADDFGADSRLVALMQYIRVVFVVLTASLVARLWMIDPAGGPMLPGATSVGVLDDPVGFAETLALAASGVIAGRWLKLPGGATVTPLLLGVTLHTTGVVHIVLPLWLMIGVYVLLGWQVGLRFTRPILRHAYRCLPQMFFSCVANVILAALSALLLCWLLGIDGLTAYLATSPGGLDSMAIISTHVQADMSMVMALQTLRFFVVVLIGPSLAKLISRLAEPAAAAPAAGQEAPGE